MQGSEHPSERLRFGVFEVDLRAGELRKHGLQIRLQEQPFQVLAILLEHGREVVTREELQKKLWSADTFVDFDQGLNKAINKIREALSDSARLRVLSKRWLGVAIAFSRRSQLWTPLLKRAASPQTKRLSEHATGTAHLPQANKQLAGD